MTNLHTCTWFYAFINTGQHCFRQKNKHFTEWEHYQIPAHKFCQCLRISALKLSMASYDLWPGDSPDKIIILVKQYGSSSLQSFSYCYQRTTIVSSPATKQSTHYPAVALCWNCLQQQYPESICCSFKYSNTLQTNWQTWCVLRLILWTVLGGEYTQCDPSSVCLKGLTQDKEMKHKRLMQKRTEYTRTALKHLILLTSCRLNEAVWNVWQVKPVLKLLNLSPEKFFLLW